jgi:hypothetical protein
MSEVFAQVLVAREMAQALPSNPHLVQKCRTEAEEAMNAQAIERGRKVGEAPRFIDARDTGLGYVELTFHANTVPA